MGSPLIPSIQHLRPSNSPRFKTTWNSTSTARISPANPSFSSFPLYKFPPLPPNQTKQSKPATKTDKETTMSAALNRDYNLGPELGSGRFGTVYHCTSAATGEAFAVKSIDKSLLTDPLDRESLLIEPKLTQLASAGTDSIVKIHAVYEDSSSLHLILDLCSSDLFDQISDKAPFTEPEAASVMHDLIQSIALCHKRGVAHRDIKPDNILFDSSGKLKLADFGSAGCFGDGERMSGLVGTPYYVAPEVVRREEYNEKVDVWSAGVVLYMMLGGMPPFHGESTMEVFEKVLRGNLRFPTRVFGGVSSAAKDLMRKMMCRDVGRRLSAEQVLRHPWIRNAEGGMKCVD